MSMSFCQFLARKSKKYVVPKQFAINKLELALVALGLFRYILKKSFPCKYLVSEYLYHNLRDSFPLLVLIDEIDLVNVEIEASTGTQGFQLPLLALILLWLGTIS